MPHTGGTVLGPLFLATILSVSSAAQSVGPFGKADLGNPESVSRSTEYDTAPGTGVLVLHVFDEKKGAILDGRVQLLLTNLANHLGLVQSISGDQEGIFANVQPGNYEIEVGAFGFVSVYQDVEVIATVHREPIEIVLHRDPAAVSLEVSDSVISPKARKEARHAVSLLKLGDFAEAQKHLETAYGLARSSSDLNFLLGYLYFQERDYKQAETYLSAAANLSPNSSRTLTLLGRTDLQLENFTAARSALEQAVLADDDNWLPHSLLADAYLHQKDYGKARDESQIAITRGEKIGKNVASPAQVVLGQALLGLGQEQEAIHALETFLKDSPENPLVYQVHALIAELEKKIAAGNPGSSPSHVDTVAARANPLDAVPNPSVTTQTWRPPDIDDTRPPLVPGVVCPSAKVLDESGKRVQEFVQDLTRFAADEDLVHQSLDTFGFPTRTEIRKYAYVALVSEPKPGAISIDEYRADQRPQEGYPDAIRSTGFITLALVFHPSMQQDFTFQCEGQAEWNGQASWLVHFRQRHDRPNRMHSYSLGDQVFPVGLKGRAWISADKFQIVRIEADIVKPVPEIKLLSEHQTVEYGPVPFPKKNTTLWLPKQAEIYFDFRKHHYYRRHSFDHYMLFSVDTEEKRKEPGSNPPRPDGLEDKQPS
jgi:tetratricopeptide (TPR) repeat protein